ncbi:MAG TPA: hypothetical protein IAA06_00120 [Candidatus Blautia faecavium]|uniref:Uncharacterized protein n=1 Tax=Candidatus Blautia faecavium TaxID=2838487 RepID=A0A9D2LPI2_9FIRM|nr:hypothetical protein [Candidatus Blautia faecavium]
MNARYPNLELLEYKVRMVLASDEEFLRTFEEKKKSNKYVYVEINAVMFPQIWGSTCTGFDICEDGSPALGGCAMTKEYTTVLHELLTDTYFVCFGERICYKVTNASKEFHEDLQRRRMASLSEAKRRY